MGRPVPDWQDEYQQRPHSAFRDELTAVEGLDAAIDQLTGKTCVASSGTHEKMKLTLGLAGSYERFVGRIYSTTEVERGKPEPDLFLHAAARSDLTPDRCVVVEDSRSGVEAARAAGMRSLGYAGGLTPPSWLEGAGTIASTNMVDLPELLGSV